MLEYMVDQSFDAKLIAQEKWSTIVLECIY
jgi:hypothetical protein